MSSQRGVFSLGLLWLAASSCAPPGPVLVFCEGSQVDLRADQPGAALALRVMAPRERARLLGALSHLGDRLATAAQPLFVDVDEQAPPDEALREALRSSLPKWNAAATLLAGRWSFPDGRLAVTAAARCPPGGRCTSARSRSGESDARRARFFAWPISTMAEIELDDERAAATSAKALRDRAADEDSRIALVFGPADFAANAAPDEDSRRISVEAGRILSALDRAAVGASLERGLLVALASNGPPLVPPAWLPLAAKRLFVVPRLGALARIELFVEEIERIAKPRRFIYRPLPLD